jgi:signal transduction histidine kinase
MRARPRRGALGLRGRIVGLVLFTTAATLAVAALTLLGPLESKLRSSALTTLVHELGQSPAAPFKGLDLTNIGSDPRVGPAFALSQQQQLLASRVGGIVTVLGYPDPSGHGVLLLQPQRDVRAVVASDPYNDAAAAFRSGKRQNGLGTIDGTEYAQVAIRFDSTSPWYDVVTKRRPTLHWVLAIRKRIDEVPRAVSAVRTAFLTAALAGFGLTLLLAIPLSATLVRRLRRLRRAALRLAREGPGGEVEVPVDRARDEVGDLARTFSAMQRQLQQQEEARRAFVATASHELRTPLTSLDGMLELLHDDLHERDPDLDEARTLLARARVQTRRLARLASDLLDLSRLDADVKLRSEPVELGELSRAVLAEFELGTAERGLTTSLEVAEGQVWALGDPGSVARILRILLDNAVRHSPEGREIRVELHGGSTAELSVSDQGPGVVPEDRAIIFERFQRGRDTAGIAGFGLGLAIGRELATRMGGHLELDETHRPGARFTLTLPVARRREIRELAVS